MRRLHPVSPLFLSARLAYQMIYPLLGSFAWSSYQSYWLMYAILALIAAGALWQYLFFRYALEDEQLVVSQGLIFRKHRKIPYTRIQNINTAQNPLHRLLGVATVQLESASGGKPEAVLRVVDQPTIAQIRRKVLAAHADTAIDTKEPSLAATQNTNQPVLHMSPGDVARYGLASQQGMLVFALAAGFFSQNPHWHQYAGTKLAQLGWIPHWAAWSRTETMLMAIAAIVALFLLLQVFTVAWALIRFYGFKLWAQTERLFAEMGLLPRVTATIPRRRIQLYRIQENPIHRWLGGVTVTVETAGGVNTEQQGLVMRYLAPYIPHRRLVGFFATIEPSIRWRRISWRSLPLQTWQRVFKRWLAVWFMVLPAAGLLMWFAEKPVWPVALSLALVPPISWWYARAWVRHAGYEINASRFSVRHGVLFRKQVHVKLDKVQTISIHQSPFDRRHDTGTLKVDTAGGNPMEPPVQMPYLPLNDAVRMRDFILRHIRHNPPLTTDSIRNGIQSRA